MGPISVSKHIITEKYQLYLQQRFVCVRHEGGLSGWNYSYSEHDCLGLRCKIIVGCWCAGTIGADKISRQPECGFKSD